MKKFKPHDKVVFKTDHLKLPLEFFQSMQPHVIWPKENEICTIMKESVSSPGFFILREYPVSKNGTLQGISNIVLFPIDEFHAKETERLLNKISESIYKLTPEKK